jgi:hypothetical protein
MLYFINYEQLTPSHPLKSGIRRRLSGGCLIDFFYC